MRRKTAILLVLFLTAVCYFFAGLLGIQAHLDPGEMDTTAYLSAAYQIRQTGGVFCHLQNCLSGVYREATQNPLYLLVLSLFAKQDISFFINAKIAGFIIGFILLCVFFASGRKILGLASGLIACCFLVTAATFLNLSTMVVCEGLLGIFFILFWCFASLGFERRVYWLWAGAFAAGAFLTKSIGIFLLPAFLISVLIRSRGHLSGLWKDRFFWGFFAVFFILCAPLLLRNTKVYGTVFYSDSTAVLWMDRWHDYYRPDIETNPPTLAAYLQTHTPFKILSVISEGLFGRNPKMISDGLKPFAFWQNPLNLRSLQGFHVRAAGCQEVWAALLFLLCLAGLWRMRKTPAALIASVSGLVFFIFVGWYSKVFPGNPPTRLLYPIFFIVWFFAAKTLSDSLLFFLAKIKKERWQEPAALGLAGLFLSIFLTCILTHYEWKKLDIRKSYVFSPLFLEQLRWMDLTVRDGQKVMAGNVFMSYYFYFKPVLRGPVIQWPQVKSLDELHRFVKTQSVKYGILDLSTVVYNLNLYKDYFTAGPKIGLYPTRPLPAFFQRVYTDRKRPALYEVYKFVS